MWGVSWSVVMLMMADSQRTDYDRGTESSTNKNKGGSDEVIDLSDPANIAKLKLMAQ